MIPRLGETVHAGRVYRRRPGAYAILRDGDDLLITVQFADKPDFQLPGGGIDAGEAPLPALHREIREETGWKVRIDRRLGAFRRFTYMPEYDLWAEKICHVYLGRPTLRVGEPTEPDHMAVFLPMQEAMSRLGNEGDRRFVRALCDGNHP
ncbi:NUDIX hydrolase [Tropicimonas sp. S265A]|uniref:NUDIX hydrolase n=1 Tax=Tropicimonas sp. S265A TaxID=3415134 RepID=UPI003C7A8F7A